MKYSIMHDEYILSHAESIFALGKSANVRRDTFKAIFGVRPNIVWAIWAYIRSRRKPWKKIFILRQVYRHPLDDHWLYFHAVAQIVALTIKETNPLFAL